ncbi:MAG: hypothetical protein K1X29_06070 [Bdellovibrionales bacterium]|nr:hypothetical protein [Bdellovibrionales bacterium]
MIYSSTYKKNRKSIYPFCIGFGLMGLIHFAGTEASASFEFNPIVAQLTPTGPGATVSFSVTNLDATKIPVQISIVSREPDMMGKETYKVTPEAAKEIAKKFNIYPPQLVLNPKETRTIRVSWIGESNSPVEIPFRIIAEELPIDLDDPNKVYKNAVAKIAISTRYIGSLYITPTGAKPKLKVEAFPAKENKENLVLQIENEGTAHQVIKNPKLTISLTATKDAKPILISGNSLRDLFNQNILAKKSRMFILPWPKELTRGNLKVSLDIAQD